MAEKMHCWTPDQLQNFSASPSTQLGVIPRTLVEQCALSQHSKSSKVAGCATKANSPALCRAMASFPPHASLGSAVTRPDPRCVKPKAINYLSDSALHLPV